MKNNKVKKHVGKTVKAHVRFANQEYEFIGKLYYNINPYGHTVPGTYVMTAEHTYTVKASNIIDIEEVIES